MSRKRAPRWSRLNDRMHTINAEEENSEMPVHYWTRVEAGDFHDFHQCWIVGIRNALNGGLLPPNYMAMAEQVTGRPIPGVVTLQVQEPNDDPGGIAVTAAPPS